MITDHFDEIAFVKLQLFLLLDTDKVGVEQRHSF